MKNKKVKLFLMIVIGGFCLLGLTNSSYATYVNIKPSSSSANPGKTISLTISSDCVGRVNLSVSNGSLGTDKVWIEGNNAVVDVTVGNSGKTVITATPEDGLMSNNGVDVPVNSTSTTIEINGSGEPSEGGETTTKSSNANLSDLGIKPNDFTGFKAGTTKYYVTVENSVEEVSVYAKPQHAKATVSGVGRKTLKEGSNPLSVTVTAEDGTKKTYTIYVTRKTADDENTVPNVVDEPETPTEEKLRLTAIALQEDLNLILNPTFNPEVFEYTLEVGADVEKIELSGIPNINDAKVTISGNEKLVEGENTITLKIAKEGMEEVTYTIKVTKRAETMVSGITTTYHSTMPTPFYVAEKIEKDAQLIMYLAVAIAVVGISVCSYEYGKTRKLAYAEEYDEDEYEPEDNSWGQMNSREEINFEKDENIQGRTVDLISPDEWEEEERTRKKKGKHF